MKYFFPVHINGGNRGCEGIAKGTAIVLNKPVDKLIGLCTDVSTDRKLAVDRFVTLTSPRKTTIWFKIINRLYCFVQKILQRDAFSQSSLWFKYIYGDFIRQMKSEDVLVSTGGDMMCYDDNFSIYTALAAKKRGCKTILWGCSMGEKNLTPRKEEALRSFDLVYARETLSQDFFLSLGLKNVICFPDPAFALNPDPTLLPSCFSNGKVIGLNLSNLTVGDFHLDTPFGQEVRQLLDYILSKTDYQIILIPHVIWREQDDRVLANNVFEEYKMKSKGRLSILDINNLNYLNIRYIIKNCHIFIGGRTHAIISAYSTCTPAIALGYSIKSKGIAHDIGLSEDYVVNTKKEFFNGELLAAFLLADRNHSEIKNHLKSVIPAYCEQTKQINSQLSKLGFE